MNSIINRKRENIIYFLIGCMVLLLPIFVLHNEQQLHWHRIIMEWVRILPLLIVFGWNNFFLLPHFFLKKKYPEYFIILLASIFIIVYLGDYTRYVKEYFISEERPLKNPPYFDRNQIITNNESKMSAWVRILNTTLLSILVVGFNTAVKLIFKRHNEEKALEEKQKLYLQTELSFLRQQISPHFFMNTLNNIHALIDIEQSQAQRAIIELSNMMRYLLEGSQQHYSTIKEEFDFLNSYIDLMRLRCSDKVKISINLNVENPGKKIHPLLFVSLVENAFKHGISYRHDSYIDIKATIEGNRLIFQTENYDFQKKADSARKGIGMENLQKQLSLLYGKNYELNVKKIENKYITILIIPLNDNMHSY